MERGLVLLVATLMVFGAREVEGTSHLSFSNMTVNVTRDGCGSSKLCVASPDDCDPNQDNMCFLASAMAGTAMPPNGTEVMFELAGYSMDFVSLGLTSGSSNATTKLFFCYVRNGTLRFRTMERNNSDDALTPTETRVTMIRGNMTGSRVRCEFTVPMLNATMTRANADTTFSMEIANGTFSNGVPTFNMTLVRSGPLDLSNPASNVPNTTTSTPGNTAGHFHATALLVLLGVSSLSVL